ncbi:MAG: OmpA family protein, partial [Planctomycetaceae bacterium]
MLNSDDAVSLQPFQFHLQALSRRFAGAGRFGICRIPLALCDLDLLFFRTNEDVLSAGVEDRLAALAEVLAGLPAVNISIEGYADERGASDYNLALSERRAARVQDLLVYHGVDPARILVKARGEAAAATADSDGYALQRR